MDNENKWKTDAHFRYLSILVWIAGDFSNSD